MACGGKVSPVTMFEQDPPTATFTVTRGGVPAEMVNYSPELHIINPDGTPQAVFGMTNLGNGQLAVVAGEMQKAVYDTLEQDISYSAQIYLKPTVLSNTDIGLLDIVDPYWLAYIPPTDPPSYDHVPGWESGQIAVAQTIPVEFPWDVYESFRLRGA